MSRGYISVRNTGGFVARFSVEYTRSSGSRTREDSGNISLGVNKSIELPPGSTDISLKVEEMWGFGWSTIFDKHYSSVVNKEFQVYGTTLAPCYKEI